MMKALTIRQPYAIAIFCESGKDIENRTWTTDYRGELLIHAGSSRSSLKERSQVEELLGFAIAPELLTFGAILGRVELVEITTTAESRWAIAQQYHWRFANPQRFAEPIPCNGALSLWRPDEEVIERVKRSEVIPLCARPGARDA